MVLTASRLATFLGKPLVGEDVRIQVVCTLDRPLSNSLLFATQFSEKYLCTLNETESCLVLACHDYAGRLTVSHILSENPRLDLALVLQAFFDPPKESGVKSTAVVAEDVRMGEGVHIGDYTVVGKNVKIGDHTVISHHVVISDNCSIGSHCLIKSHSVIGEKGFGFVKNLEGRPINLPHLGTVRIGDHVEIGALNTVARGVIDNTVIEDHVKIDDHVHIAHNVKIGENAIIIACAEISGSAIIGKGAWLGPNCAIMDNVKIGVDAVVGLGAVVTKTVADGASVLGNPARVIALKRSPEISNDSEPGFSRT